MKSGFLQGAALLSAGNVLAQLIALLCAPVLARLLPVEAFGIYALYTAALGLTAQVVCLKLDMALALTRDHREAAALMRLAVGAAALTAALSGLLLPLSPVVGRLLRTSNLDWIGLLPLSLLGSGLTDAGRAAALREGRYQTVGLSALLRVGSMAFLQLMLALSGNIPQALILGQTLSYLPALPVLLPGLVRLARHRLTAAELHTAARRNRAFVGFTAPGAILSSGAHYLTSFMLSALFSQAVLGRYSLAVRLLSAPQSLLTTPLSQAFMRELAGSRHAGSRGRGFMLRLVMGLGFCAAAGAAVLHRTAGWALPWLLGRHWAEAVPIFRILLPLYAVRFALVPVSGAAIVVGRQRETLIWQAMMLGLSALPALFWPTDAHSFLMGLSVCLSVGYIGFFIYSLGLFTPAGEMQHG